MKALKYSDISLVPNYSTCETRAACDPSVNFLGTKFLLPVIPANMKSVINLEISRWMSSHGYFYIMHRFVDDIFENIKKANHESWHTISFSCGVKTEDINLVKKIKETKLKIDFLTIDVAHGHCIQMRKMIEHVKHFLPSTKIIAGNVSTSNAVADLSSWGADAVKVGIGQGSPCTTKDKTGFTMPMFSCVQQCSKVPFSREDGFMVSSASNIEALDIPEKIPVIADGGIKFNGDIAKAIAAGADSVMLGSLLAGTKEAPGEVIIFNGRRFKSYRGMGSVEAMKKGSKDRYFQGKEEDNLKLVPEGIEGRVPYKGELFATMHQFIGGLRAGMGYCGAPTIDAQKRNSSFVKITASGIAESHPHDVTITKEAPNYSR